MRDATLFREDGRCAFCRASQKSKDEIRVSPLSKVKKLSRINSKQKRIARENRRSETKLTEVLDSLEKLKGDKTKKPTDSKGKEVDVDEILKEEKRILIEVKKKRDADRLAEQNKIVEGVKSKKKSKAIWESKL